LALVAQQVFLVPRVAILYLILLPPQVVEAVVVFITQELRAVQAVVVLVTTAVLVMLGLVRLEILQQQLPHKDIMVLLDNLLTLMEATAMVEAVVVLALLLLLVQQLILMQVVQVQPQVLQELL